MTTDTQQILNRILGLPPVERAELLEQIFTSFDFPARGYIDKKWSKEVEDRIDAYERGELKAKPVQDALDKIDHYR